MFKSFVFVGLIVVCAGNVVRPNVEDNIFNEKVVEGVIIDARQGKSLQLSAMKSLWSCGSNLGCWVDKGDEYLEYRRNLLLGKFRLLCLNLDIKICTFSSL